MQMINRLRQQHFSARTLCKHVELQIVKCDPKSDPVLQKKVVLLILSASLLNPSSYFYYVTGSAMRAFTLAQSSFIQWLKYMMSRYL